MSSEFKQVIVVRTDLKMRKGKLGAQCAHAGRAFMLEQMKTDGSYSRDPDPKSLIFTPRVMHRVELELAEQTWVDNHHPTIVLGIESEASLTLLADSAERDGLKVHRIVDCGMTEFHGVKTFTCIGIGPDLARYIDPFTSGLTPL